MTPPRLLGRVSAINILAYGARPLGSAIGAIVGGLYGAETCLYLAVAIFGAQALVILLSPAVSLARQPDMVGDAEPRSRLALQIALIAPRHRLRRRLDVGIERIEILGAADAAQRVAAGRDEIAAAGRIQSLAEFR